ncbi:MAG TPA: hypothetical protein G4O05_01915 [Caldilineae bacterium]|nr:hypothetical protein [Caldilineae bacterium]
MDKPRDQAAVRKLVKRVLKHEPQERCWEAMIERGLVDDVLNEPSDWQEPFDYLVQQYRQCEELVRKILSDVVGRQDPSQREQSAIQAEPTEDRRWEALSLLFRKKAERQIGIRSFWEAVKAPIPDPVTWVDRARSSLDRVIEALVKSQVHSQLVEQTSFTGEEEAAKEFDELAEAVKERYGLDLVDAHLFLTQKIWPKQIGPGRAHIKYHPIFPCLDRLVLEVDPCLREEGVVELYREVRRAYWRGMYRKQSRAGRVSDKAYALLRFVLEDGEGLSWRKRLERWNERYPPGHPWHYRYETNMARDFHRLIQRLVGMSYEKFLRPNVRRPMDELVEKNPEAE